MPEWLIERGIGETRAILVDDGEIIEARIELDGTTAAGSVVAGRLANAGTNGRNAVVVAAGGLEFLLPGGAGQITQGATLNIEVTRERIPGPESWKRPLGRATDKAAMRVRALVERLGGRQVAFPAPKDAFGEMGWDDVLDQARRGFVRFAGGELRISATPAMTLIDVDGYLPPEELAVLGASAAAQAIRRLDIGGSIGIDLPTAGNKATRQQAAAAIGEALPLPFERTAVNGFGFVQIVRPRTRASLLELAQDRAAFEARALLRAVTRDGPGPKRIVAHPNAIAVLARHPEWIDALSAQVGGKIELRGDASLPISGGYATSL